MTTATAAPRRAYARTAGRWDALAGTGTLIRFILRRDRVRLPVWILAIAILGPGIGRQLRRHVSHRGRPAGQSRCDGKRGRQAVHRPGIWPDHYTYGAMTANELLPLTAVAVALMSIFLVVRHTRAEEESGRADLVRAAVVGRHAPTVATLTVVGGANVVLAVCSRSGCPRACRGYRRPARWPLPRRSSASASSSQASAFSRPR